MGGDLLADDATGEFSELIDAVIDRVDLVRTPANGRPFVLMKQAADGAGVVSAAAVRNMIEKGQGMTAGSGTTVRLVQKAGKPQLAVYDENGKLIGLVDPKDLQPVKTTGDDEQAAQDANAARVAAQSTAGQAAQAAQQRAEQQAQAAESVTKAMSAALAGVKPGPGLVRKSGRFTVSEGFAELVKRLDPARADVLRVTVSSESMKLVASTGMPPAAAVGVAKRAAVRVGQLQGLI